jgi:hypothetical protein
VALYRAHLFRIVGEVLLSRAHQIGEATKEKVQDVLAEGERPLPARRPRR